jgi:hypothetical protein
MDDQALAYLREGVNPDVWSQRLTWFSPGEAMDVDRNAQMAQMAIWGLALSGKPEGRQSLIQLRSAISADQAKYRADTEQVLRRALAAHEMISRLGLAGYYSRPSR